VNRFELVLAMVAGLLLARASVFAQDLNVAPLGVTSQSSEYPPTPFPASNAVDGNLGNFTHTGAGQNLPSTWQDDLGSAFPIKLVNLYNRADCCQHRLRDITVTILAADGATVAFESELLNAEDADLSPPVITLDLESLTGAAVDGRTVIVKREPDPDFSGQGGAGSPDDADVLSLAEVEILVDPTAVDLRITRQPVGARLYVGDNHTLSVAVFGAEPITYRWRKGNVDIPNATSPTLQILGAKLDDAGSYDVVVTNGIDTVTSDPVAITVPGLNLALYGAATQSTTQLGSSALLAIDGNIDGIYANRSVAQTRATGDNSPFWEVALAATSTIERVVLWNRTDCCASRLTNFRVSVLNANRVAVFEQDYFTDGVSFPDTSVSGFEIPLAANTKGRFVRIAIQGPNSEGSKILALAEVEVFGTGQTFGLGENLARRRSAFVSQSSTLGGFVAELGVNNNRGDFTHTLAGTNLPATWEVNLGGVFPIGEVILYNRTSCCGSRLRDITITILDPTGTDVLYESELLNPENEQGLFPNGPATLGANLVTETGGAVNGQIVRVVRTPDDDLSGTAGQGNTDEADVLSLGEVEIFPFSECPEQGDTHCQGITVAGPEGGGPGIYECTATAGDDTNDVVLYTFTASKGAEIAYTSGPGPENTASFELGIGNWVITVAVDDNLRCEDEAPDASCSTNVSIEGCGNVAQGAEAAQSSDYPGGLYPASLAVNGNLDDFTHTAAGQNLPSTWEANLGAVLEIQSIVLHNRTSCCGSRLRDITVAVLSLDGQDLIYESELLNPENEQGVFPDGPPSLTVDLVAELGSALAGGRVRITRTPDEDLSGTGGQGNPDEADVLSLGEVEIIACIGEVTPPGTRFHRGDGDDNGKLELTDAVRILGYLFLGATPPTCFDAADADDNGLIQLTDAVRILGYLFLGQAPPAPPGPPGEACGLDADAEDPDLGCESYGSC